LCPRTPSTLRTAPSGAPFSFLKDERELFNLANGFAIRHNTNSRCDQIIVLRLKERESKAAAVQQA